VKVRKAQRLNKEKIRKEMKKIGVAEKNKKELRRSQKTFDPWPQGQNETKRNCWWLFFFFLFRFTEFPFVVLSGLDLNGTFVLKLKQW